MERYSTLWRMPENAYSLNSPVIVRAGALLKDNETNNLLIQLKLENITEKLIRSVKVKLSLFDIEGRTINTNTEHQFINLSEGYRSSFGQQYPIVVSDFSVSRFEITEIVVIFDNFKWNSTQKYVPVTATENYLLNITDTDMFNKFIAETNHSLFWKEHQAEKLKISNAITKLNLCKSSNPEVVNTKIKEYTSILNASRKADSELNDNEKFQINNIENMLQLFETEKKEYKKEKSKKITSKILIAMVVVIFAIVLFVAGILLMFINFGYNSTVSDLNNGYFESAIAGFELLGSYKDSEEKLLEAKFGLAEKMESISIEEAYNQYNMLPADYNGVKEKIEYLKPYLVYTERYNKLSVTKTDGNGKLISEETSFSNNESITLNLCLKDGKLCYAPDALTEYNNAVNTFTYEYVEFRDSEDSEYRYYCEYDNGFLNDYFIYLSESSLKIIHKNTSIVYAENTVITETIYTKW